MKNKIAVYPHGYATMEKTEHSGMYLLKVYTGPDGAESLQDKITCDDYQDALEYWRAFKAIAKAA